MHLRRCRHRLVYILPLPIHLPTANATVAVGSQMNMNDMSNTQQLCSEMGKFITELQEKVTDSATAQQFQTWTMQLKRFEQHFLNSHAQLTAYERQKSQVLIKQCHKALSDLQKTSRSKQQPHNDPEVSAESTLPISASARPSIIPKHNMDNPVLASKGRVVSNKRNECIIEHAFTEMESLSLTDLEDCCIILIISSNESLDQIRMQRLAKCHVVILSLDTHATSRDVANMFQQSTPSNNHSWDAMKGLIFSIIDEHCSHNAQTSVGSVWIQDVRDCVFYCECRQLRIHKAVASSFFISSYTPKSAIIESSSQLLFGPWSATTTSELAWSEFQVFDFSDPASLLNNFNIVKSRS